MQDQIINEVVISSLIKNELNKVVTEKPLFTTYDIFITLEKFLLPSQIMKLLDIGKTSFYNYKRTKNLRYVERKLYDLYLLIDF